MRNMNNSQKTIASALGAELGISEADFGGKLKIEGKDPVSLQSTTSEIQPRSFWLSSV